MMDQTNLDGNIQICRLCGQVSEETVIDIFNGSVNNLHEKINEYLPITIRVNDTLPLTSCVTCTKTLLSFDQLVRTCTEANKCFEQLQADTNQELAITNPIEAIENTSKGYADNDNEPNLTEYCAETNEEKFEASDVQEYQTFCNDEAITLSSEKPQVIEIDEVKEMIDGKLYYKCKICGKCLHSSYTYKFHMKIHTGERPYVCDFCGKQFRIPQGLQRHISETHAGIKRYQCDLCDRRFATKQSALEHRNIHTNERPYICDLCGKAFKQKASLFVHTRSHTEEFPFRCGQCNHSCRTKSLLARHVTKHTGEKPHACDVCGKTFRIKNEMSRHKLVHSDDKPFKCSLCGLGFRMKRYLKKHLNLNHKSRDVDTL